VLTRRTIPIISVRTSLLPQLSSPAAATAGEEQLSQLSSAAGGCRQLLVLQLLAQLIPLLRGEQAGPPSFCHRGNLTLFGLYFNGAMPREYRLSRFSNFASSWLLIHGLNPYPIQYGFNVAKIFEVKVINFDSALSMAPMKMKLKLTVDDQKLC
jgi:hypothetical protein